MSETAMCALRHILCRASHTVKSRIFRFVTCHPLQSHAFILIPLLPRSAHICFLPPSVKNRHVVIFHLLLEISSWPPPTNTDAAGFFLLSYVFLFGSFFCFFFMFFFIYTIIRKYDFVFKLPGFFFTMAMLQRGRELPASQLLRG